jgi:hypothetical protein
MNKDIDKMSMQFLKYRDYLQRSRKEIEKEQAMLRSIEVAEMKKTIKK